MILTPDESEARLLDRGHSLSSQAILVAHFVFGCAGRQKGMKKSAPMGASDFPSRELAHHDRLDLGPRESGLTQLPET
jgi:hypothetical protein